MICKEMLWYCDEILHVPDRLLPFGEIVSKVLTRRYQVDKIHSHAFTCKGSLETFICHGYPMGWQRTDPVNNSTLFLAETEHSS